MLSPVQLEQNILQFEKTLGRKLGQKRWFLWVAFLISLAFCWLVIPMWTKPMPAWSRFFVAQDRMYAELTLLAGFFISLLFPLRARRWFYPLLILVSWFVPCYFLKVNRPIIFAPPVFIFLNAAILSVKVRSSLGQYLKAAFVLASFILLVWLLGKDAEATRSYDLFRYFWTLHLEMLFLFFFAASFRSSGVSRSLCLNPLQLFTPLPWPNEIQLRVNTVEVRELRALGLMQLLYAQVVFVILILVLPKLPHPPVDGNNPIHYITFLLFVSAGFSLVTGFLRMFGYNAPDATYFLMLAKTPWEIWQRGSTYVATFLFRNVYLATWIRTRKVWLAALALLIAVYANLYLFHELFLRELIRMLSPSLPIGAGTPQQIYLLPLLWMLSWLVWMGVFYGMLKVFKFLRTDWGAWIAILLTHLGSSQMFWIARNLARAMGTSLD